ncbi:MAG: hypothetical protein GY854_24170 [Deltaproteobacteria bacterium]|nr:hypothetical protein [Deltaproteobacteria bacterium]
MEKILIGAVAGIFVGALAVEIVHRFRKTSSKKDVAKADAEESREEATNDDEQDIVDAPEDAVPAPA